MFLIFIFYFILREVHEVSKKKCSYWGSYWSWLEWFIIIVSCSAVGFYIWKAVLTNRVLDTFNKTFGNGYMKLQQVALVDEFYGYHLGVGLNDYYKLIL